MQRLLLAFLTTLLSCGLLSCEPEEEERGPATNACQLGVASNTLLAEGFLADAHFWTCEPPPAGAGRARFTEYEGIPAMVSGGSSSFLLTWDGADAIRDRMLVVGVTGEQGYYTLPIPSNDNPLPIDIYIAQNASSGSRVFYLAIDDGTGRPRAPKLGSYLSIPINVINVGGGDVQISLNWDTPVDLDLHVVDPSGDEVFWQRREVASGGILDLDSNPGCSLDNVNNENAFWPSGQAPSGQYIVRVDFWSACTTAGTGYPTRYRVTVVKNGDIEVFDRSFMPDEADFGGAGSGTEVTRFTYP